MWSDETIIAFFREKVHSFCADHPFSFPQRPYKPLPRKHIRCKFRPAGIWKQSTGLFHPMGSNREPILQNKKTQELLTPAFGRSRIIGFHEIRSIKRFCSHVFCKMLSTSDAPGNGLCRPRFFSLGHFVTKLRPSALASGRRQRAQHATTSGQPVPKSPGLGRLPNKRFCSPTGCKNSKCGHTCPACR